ncbi:solute carrier family 46 member 3 [Patella vulgata]|uniref:solute carrier family 46 member 3 n=1 Tax=Patella vulgata TaxID=6465 RepID=UPI00217FE6D9|nr:solute carrier family 46 member 3 [Patella vulgata]
MEQQDDEKTSLLNRKSEGSLPPNFPIVRAWIVSGVSVVFYMMAAVSLTPVMSQYVVQRLKEAKFNATFLNITDNDISSPCGNHSNLTEFGRVEQEVQKEASMLTLYYSLTAGSSAILINIFMGPLSDSIGRKTIYLIPVMGVLCKNLIIMFIVYYNMNLNYFYLAYGIDGLCGSYYAVLVAMFSYSADITVPGNSRTIAIAVLEGCLAVAASVGQLATGYLIKSTGFFYPMVMVVCISALDIVIVFFLLPETLTVKRKAEKSPLKSIKKVFGFYFTEGSRIKRCAYQTALGVFFFSVVTTLGRTSLETIYQLGVPFCWDSIKIGYYGAARLTISFICGVLALKILQKFLREEIISIISCLSAIAGFLLEGMADTSLLMYLVPLVSLIGAASIPIARSILSKMALPSQQGSLFASIAIVETICNSTSNLLYSAVYNATVEYYKGIVWFMMAGMALIDIIFLIAFIWISGKGGDIYPTYEIKVTVNDDSYGSSEKPNVY